MWKIGQEIVCIKTHSKGVVKRGQIYTIQALRKSICNCYSIIIDVGINNSHIGGICRTCGKTAVLDDNIWWFSEKLFAPLEYNADGIKELIEEPILINK